MTTWIIGDIQGCCSTLETLLDRIDFQPDRDHLSFVGDLVNRGPRSYDALHWIWQHRAHTSTVLGNHDLHLLMRAAGVTDGHRRDTLDTILQSDDLDDAIDWLRAQPFLRSVEGGVVVHAGIHPEWSLDDAMTLSQELVERLARPDWPHFLAGWRAWKGDHHGLYARGDERLYGALNVFTRMRTLHPDGRLDFSFSGRLQDVPAPLRAWFQVERRVPLPCTVAFGHWAALGHHVDGRFIALDSGCVWGRGMTAWSPEQERAVFQPAVD